ncbi:PucR C-terminal helix-turn-helix domain-containing protein [Parafrankia irregularis]|uniref:PucR C-terminal helix-turn-helix domain-containing protein n=2 Tax=Parafrankia TaxID=2994362 RepID=A0A0S4QTK8_9ACTN|nr:helix-turn-helix domain-containing protein [Parafrankia irregularis]MBE3202433.1 helix-turn-helix domain-containing protein [Parafrankia sp. CH37]CUU58949.1 PucR C-terminal helix-turn-helix domain-containing protein [Parafrankia irregularis]
MGLQDIAEDLAARLGRSVAIDDLDSRLLAHTAHEEPVDQFRIDSIMLRRPRSENTVTRHARDFGIDTATGPVRIPASPRLGSFARLCVPVRCSGTLLGYLWLFDEPTPVPDDDLEPARAAAAAAGEVLFRERLLDDLRRASERELLRDILNPDDEVRRHAAARLVADHGIAPDARVLAAAVVIDHAATAPDSHAGTASPAGTVELDLALRRARQRLTPTRALGMATSATGGILLLMHPRLPRREALRAEAERIHADLATHLPASAVWVGLGPERPALREGAGSYREALETTRVARLVPSLGQTVFSDQLGVYGLLARLPLESLESSALPAGLRRLLAADRSGALVQTLETYLDLGGDPARTAARLVIHRTTLYYRLGRIVDLTGLDLRDGNDRLALHLGLKLRQMLSRGTPQAWGARQT